MSDAGEAPAASQPPHVGERLPAIGGEIADTARLLVALDFDGTLAPIRTDPGSVRPVDGSRALLERLAARPTVTVGVVSGRALADVRRRVGLDGVHYAGNHGLEYEIDGEREVHPVASDAVSQVQAAIADLEDELAAVPDVAVEDKRLTATVHYREAAGEGVPAVRATVASVVDRYDGLRTSDGKQIVEVRPGADLGKDAAVERFAADREDQLVIYVGDDVTDEDAFAAVEPDGFGVKVGDGADTVGSAHVADPLEAVAFLRWLTTALARSERPAAT